VLLIASPDRLLRHRLVADATADNRDVTSVASCTDLVHAVATCGHALVVLDDRLVEANLCGLVQEVTRHGPGVLVMTSDGSELNVVLLMELGADDVVVRPFSLRELNARIRAILRRRLPAPLADTVDGPISLNEESRLVILHGRQLHIPRLEFAVLHALQARHGEPVPRAVLLDECWPCTAVRRPEYVNAVIRRLRVRLEDRPSEPQHLVMVRGKGYALRA
jgi:DNA-binding response OmpR family regulator